MAFISEETLQAYSYAGSGFHAPQVFREPIFSRAHLTVSLCLDDYLFFLTDDYVVIFPAFFLRFNKDGTISFLTDSYIQRYRRNIFGIPLYQVSDIVSDEAVPAIHTGTDEHGRKLPNREILRQKARDIPNVAQVGDILGCVKMEIDGTLYYLSTKNTEKYNTVFYGSPDYADTIDHFNACVRQYHQELEDLVSQGILFPVRELQKRRNDRRETISRELSRLSAQISALDEELKEERFSLSPLRIQERRGLKKHREELEEKYAGWQAKYRYL
ncbi:MAG: hypothetical protein LUF34_10485 [Lachnospiraceae bacterium]|nr:hypothetical protein [Lachnospiraceae bacterium]